MYVLNVCTVCMYYVRTHRSRANMYVYVYVCTVCMSAYVQLQLFPTRVPSASFLEYNSYAFCMRPCTFPTASDISNKKEKLKYTNFR